MTRSLVALVLGFGLLLGACARPADPAVQQAEPQVATQAVADDAITEDAHTGVTIVVAPSIRGRVNESLVLDAYRRAYAQGEQDFGLRPKQPVTIYVDPDSVIGLEDALGLSAKNAIHLRAGRAQS